MRLLLILLLLMFTLPAWADDLTKLKAENKLYESIVKDFHVYGELVSKYLIECKNPPETKQCQQLFYKIIDKTPTREE